MAKWLVLLLALALSACATVGFFFTFVRGLIDAHRADRKVSAAEWLAALTRVSGDASLAAHIKRMVDEGVPEPEPLLRSLFARAGATPPA